MTKAARSSAIFGVYLTLSGLGLAIIPNSISALAGLPPTNAMWTRMFGAIIGILGLYYIQAARENNLAFFRMTLWGRGLVCVSFVTLVLMGVAAPIIAVAGLIDLCCALWTWLAIRREEQVSPLAESN
ncbi:MAG TPA: hypothetical protein VKQ72_07415 [Aggregatilineales bacterium]|nr:hypothetical protein [Aggregatilineales bacterium]